ANQSFVEQVAAKPEPLRIDSESQPVAFGSLLETPAERPEEDSSFTTTTSPEFAMEHDWRDCDEEEMDAEEEEPAAWRPEGTGDEEEVPATKSKKSKSGSNDWRMGGFEQIAAGKSGSIGWGPEEETPAPVVTPPVVVAPVEAAPVASSRAPEIPTPVETAPTASGLTRETPLAPPPLVEEKTPIPVASKPFAAETWAPLSPPPPSPVAPVASNETHLAETATVVEDKIPSASEPKPKEKEVTKDSWFSVSSSPWESEIQKASQLASTWDTPAAANPSAAPKNGTEKTSDVSAETKAVIEEAALPPIALEAIREEAAQVTQDTEFVPEGTLAASQGTSFYAEEEEGVFEPNSPPPQTSAPAATATNMDDLVAKVLAKLNPEVLQAVTREILKPVVEAMVEEELKSKKQ
ncbi:MAG TPA: hypothetical protein VNB49_06485, partial [Candidatus Dormibacteraeota bacterium]|nr:hypothetical protein [Candidatus Dormibacteraeota bacterium]